MASFEFPQMPETKVTPQLLMGAYSPLWSYFGAAAAGGVAYWWMTRWTQTANLEALFGSAWASTPSVLMMEAAAEPALEAMEAAAEVVEEVLEAVSEALPQGPVGGEAAPISPMMETLEPPEAEPVVQSKPEAVLETAAKPEPVAEAELQAVVAAAVPEPAAETPSESMIEATAAPIPEPVAKPKVRRTPPANGLEA